MAQPKVKAPVRRIKVVKKAEATKATADKATKATKANNAVKAKAETARTAKATTFFVHWPEGYSPYGFGAYGARPEPGIKPGLIIAALVASGMATLGNKSGLLTKASGKGNAAMFRLIVGSSAYSHHKRDGRIGPDDTLTVPGINWFNARLEGNAGVGSGNTTIDQVREMLAAIAKGGKVGGLNFNRKLTA